LRFSVKVTLKKNVLDPQGKVVQQTLQNMGMDTLENLRQGKYFEIDIKENDEIKAKEKIVDMCKKLLVNLIIEDFEISKV
jgi:phosphoribosylformylglycinamidine synthase PurS subunit|tara:strand:+ start:227 stop:466 length:240 start_codon:yes stop_codon:yes gene_type:complete